MFALCRVRESVAHSSRGAVLCGRQRGRRLRLAAAAESSVQSDADSCGDCAGGVCAAGDMQSADASISVFGVRGSTFVVFLTAHLLHPLQRQMCRGRRGTRVTRI